MPKHDPNVTRTVTWIVTILNSLKCMVIIIILWETQRHNSPIFTNHSREPTRISRTNRDSKFFPEVKQQSTIATPTSIDTGRDQPRYLFFRFILSVWASSASREPEKPVTAETKWECQLTISRGHSLRPIGQCVQWGGRWLSYPNHPMTRSCSSLTLHPYRALDRGCVDGFTRLTGPGN